MLSNIDFEQVLRDAWHAMTTWVALLYTEHPLPAWSITFVILLYLLYRYSKHQQRRAEQRARNIRRRQSAKRSSRGRTTTRKHAHAHDQKDERDDDKGRRSYNRTGKKDRLDDWD